MAQKSPERRLGQGMLMVSWVIGLGLLAMLFNGWLEKRNNPNTMPQQTTANGLNEVVLQRNYQHHNDLSGQINGKSVTFLVDTGATKVSVPKSVASRLGLKPGAAELAITANGTVETRATVLDELKLGSITLYNIPASINPGMQGEEILLGMTALKNVEFTHRDGTLTLKQYY